MCNLKKSKSFNEKRVKFLTSRIDSSETTRGAPYNLQKSNNAVFFSFSFVKLKQYKKKSFDLTKVDPCFVQRHFREWLVGFIEGDGSFYVRLDRGNLRLGFEIS
jgi:hypothetical protein